MAYRPEANENQREASQSADSGLTARDLLNNRNSGDTVSQMRSGDGGQLHDVSFSNSGFESGAINDHLNNIHSSDPDVSGNAQDAILQSLKNHPLQTHQAIGLYADQRANAATAAIERSDFTTAQNEIGKHGQIISLLQAHVQSRTGGLSQASQEQG